MDIKETRDQGLDYETPVIRDYGDLKELTEQLSTGSQTDVPLGTHVPPFSIFS